MALGFKTGGRRKGVRNRASVERERQIAESGVTPLEFLLQVMRDGRNDLGARIDAAGKCAPYVHPKLQSITQVTVPPETVDPETRDRIFRDIMECLRRRP